MIAEPCEDFIDDYGDEIIHQIVDEELSPEEVCTQLQLCDQKQRQDGQGLFGEETEHEDVFLLFKSGRLFSKLCSKSGDQF